MKKKIFVIRKNERIEVEVQVFRCPYCKDIYYADQEELNEYETYCCPNCLDDVYFEDAEIK